MRVLVSFELRKDTWFIQCLAEGTRAPISSVVSVAEAATLIHVLRYVGANDIEIDEVNNTIADQRRGTVAIELAPGRKNLLQLRRPWSDGLLH